MGRHGLEGSAQVLDGPPATGLRRRPTPVRHRRRRADLLRSLTATAPAAQGRAVIVVTGPRGVGKSQLAAAYARRRVAAGWPLVAWIDASTTGTLTAGLAALSEAAGLAAPSATAESVALPEAVASSEAAAGTAPPDAGLAAPPDAARSVALPEAAAPVAAAGTAPPDAGLAAPPDAARSVALPEAAAPVAAPDAAAGTAPPDAAGLAAPPAATVSVALPVAGPSSEAAGAAPVPSSEAAGGAALPDVAQAALAAMAWLGALPGPCLLVLDDARDPAAVRPWIPAAGHVHTVITTTRQDLAEFGAHVGVGPFTSAESTDFMVARTMLIGPAVLAERLGHLPLALAQAGEIVGPRRRYDSYPALLARLDDLRDDPGPTTLDELLPKADRDPYPHSTAEAIRRTLDDLAADDPDGSAGRLLGRLAVLNPAGVDATLLDVLTGGGDAESALTRWSLATRSAQTDRLLPAHPLIGLVVVERHRHLGNFDDLLIETAELLNLAATEPGARWHFRAAIAGLAWHAAALGTHHAGEAARASIVGLQVNMLIWLCNAGAPDAAIPIAAAMINTCERLAGAEDAHTLNLRTLQVFVHFQAERAAEAVQLADAVTADLHRILGADHPYTRDAELFRASAYRIAGRTDEAIELGERLLRTWLAEHDEDHPESLRLSHFLVHFHLGGGRLEAAITLARSTLAGCERVLGPNDLQTLNVLDALAFAYNTAERHEEAIDLLLRRVPAATRLLGEDHPQVLISQNNLAFAYEHAGRLDEAIDLYERTIADGTNTIGPADPRVTAWQSNLDRALTRR